MGELIRRVKYGRDPLLAAPLSGLLRHMLDHDARGAAALPPDAIVVPVPSSRRRERERGFNLAELLAETVARATDRRLCNDRLVRVAPLYMSA